MNKKMLQILACPLCKGKLIYQIKDNELICNLDKLAFPIKDNIPVMLVSEARRIKPNKPEQLNIETTKG